MSKQKAERPRTRRTEFADMPGTYRRIAGWVGARRILAQYDIQNIERVNLQLVELTGKIEGLKVLEVGPGRGYLCHVFNARHPNNQYFVLEYEPANMNYGVKLGYFQSAEFLSIGSVFFLPFRDRKFDIVIISEVLEHLETPEVALSEMRRVLKTNGWIVASSPNSLMYLYPFPILITLLQSIHHLGDRNYRKGFPALIRRFRRLADGPNDVYDRPFLPSQFRTLLESSGFRVMKHVTSMLTYLFDPALSTLANLHPNSQLSIRLARTAIRISDNLLQGNSPFVNFAGIRQHILARKV
jgi:ubiquinone/menaquinone biosynthesis C-methylase UbiE